MAITKIKAMVDIVPEDRQPIAEKLIQELAFMDSTLTKLRTAIRKNGPILVSGSVPKANPALTAYNTTIQRFALLNKQLIDLLPAAEKPEAKSELAEFLKKKA